MLKILDRSFGVEYAMMTSVHAYTSDQPLRDTVGKEFRRSRSAAVNIIPNVSHSPRWIEHLFPQLRSRIEGSALNVPVPQGSLLDLTTIIRDVDATVETVNAAVTAASALEPDIIEVTGDPIVSSDVIGNPRTLLFDSQATMRSAGRMLKTLSWYDNILSQAHRLLDVARIYGHLPKGGAS